MDEQKHQHKCQSTPQNIGRQVGRKELACLPAVRLTYQQQHRRSYRTIELHETVHIDNGQRVGNHVKEAPHPFAYLLREKGEDDTEQIDIHEQLRPRMLIYPVSTCIRRDYAIEAHQSQYIYKKEECPILANRHKKTCQ